MLKLAIQKQATAETLKDQTNATTLNAGVAAAATSSKLMGSVKPVSGIIPTFLLRGVDPIQVLTDYLAGKYMNLPIPFSKIQAASTCGLVTSQRGNNPESEEYTYRDCSNQLRTVGTTNHEIYSLARHSDGSELPICGCCNWCRETIVKSPIGIPVKMQTALLPSEDRGNQSRTISTTYYTDGIYCTFQCALSGLLQQISTDRSYRDPNYMESEQMLRCMYKQLHPNAELLQRAPDWRLLKSNGGYLTSAQFHSNAYHYQSMPGITISPTKMSYTTMAQPFSIAKTNFYGITPQR